MKKQKPTVEITELAYNNLNRAGRKMANYIIIKSKTHSFLKRNKK